MSFPKFIQKTSENLCHSKTASVIFRAACLLFLVYMGTPFFINQIQSNLDPSWQFGLNYVQSLGYKFGKDCFFTYGPLGFLLGYIPLNGAITTVIIWEIGLSLLLVSILVYMFFSKDMAYYNARLTHILLFTILSHWALSITFNYEELLGFICLLSICLSIKSPRQSLFLWLACILMVIVFYVKFTIAAVCGGSIFLALIYRAYCKENIRRESFIACIVTPLTIFVVYMLYNPNVADFIRYIRAAVEISSGYLYAMSLPLAPSYIDERILCGIALLFYLFYIIWKNHELSFAAIFSIALFITYKHGTNIGGYAPIVFYSSFMYIGVFLYFMKTTIDVNILKSYSREIFLFMAVFIIMLWPYLGKNNSQTYYTATFTANTKTLIANRFRLYKHSYKLLTGKIPIDKTYLKLSNSFTDRIGQERFTVYPWELSYGHGFENFEIMPVFQAYTAYTPFLDELDANYFTEKRPPYIVFNLDTIGNRYPLIENPQTWLRIFENYEPIAYDGHNFLLKATTPKGLKRGEPIRLTVGKGDEITIPDSADHMLVRIKANVSSSGRLKRFLYKTKEVNMTATLDDGRSVTKRVLLENLLGETLIDAIPLNDRELYDLFRENGRYPKVKKIRFSGPGLGHYKNRLELEFIPITVTTTDAPGVIDDFYSRPLNFAPSVFEGEAMGNLDLANGERIQKGALLSGDIIGFSGWLADAQSKKACKNVYLAVDQKPCPSYRLDRRDVADVYGEDALRSGFNLWLDRSGIADGIHHIELWGEKEDGRFIRLDFGDVVFQSQAK